MLLEEVLEKRRAHSKEGLDRNAAGGDWVFFVFASEGEAAFRVFHSPRLSGWSRLLAHLHGTCRANGLTLLLMYTIAVIFL